MSDFRLKVFRSVAKNLSFTKASQELFVSQPAITKHIQELEAAYQTRLFDRRGRELALAADGTIRLGHRAHDLIARADQRLQRRHGKLRRAHENNAHRFNSLRQFFFSFCCSL